MVPHGGAEERVALSWGEREAPPKGIIEIGRVIQTVTGSKYSVSIVRQARAEAASHTVTVSRRRVGQRHIFAPVGGDSVATICRFYLLASSDAYQDRPDGRHVVASFFHA
jgi:hypothetical protein